MDSKLFFSMIQFSSVQFSRSVVSDSATPWIAARQASLSITMASEYLKKKKQTHRYREQTSGYQWGVGEE